MISGRGAVIGQVDRGSVQIVDPVAGDGSGPIVSGYEHVRNPTDTTSRYSGTDVNFRISGGQFVWEKAGVSYTAPMKPGTDTGAILESTDVATPIASPRVLTTAAPDDAGPSALWRCRSTGDAKITNAIPAAARPAAQTMRGIPNHCRAGRADDSVISRRLALPPLPLYYPSCYTRTWT